MAEVTRTAKVAWKGGSARAEAKSSSPRAGSREPADQPATRSSETSLAAVRKDVLVDELAQSAAESSIGPRPHEPWFVQPP